MRIYVGKRHIAAAEHARLIRWGKKTSFEDIEALTATSCPIAFAMLEKGFDRVWVMSYTVGFAGGARTLPPNAQRGILRFDCGKPLKPFTFWLNDV